MHATFNNNTTVTYLKLSTILLAIGLSACESSKISSTDNSLPATTLFSETTTVLPTEGVSRRKWDSALVSDLDQDGWPDLILTEHSLRAELYWNNKGKFSAPIYLINGDTHGIAASDYNQDGKIDLIVAQGGGGGTKPRNPVSFSIDKKRNIVRHGEFTHFERTRGRAVKFIDSDNNGELDLLLSAFPLKSQTQGANNLYLNNKGNFELNSKLPRAKWLGYKTLITDFNNDNIADVLFYGGANMVAIRGDGNNQFTDISNQVFGQLKNINNISAITEIDFDNDGDFDLFLTRAKHQFEQQTFFDPIEKRFAFFARNEKFEFPELKIKGNFKLENLQMAFPHFDVFLGNKKQKVEFNVDRHGEKNLELTQQQAQGWPKKMSKKGLYIGYIGNNTWKIAGETKSPTAGVIHNVESAPTTKALEQLPVYLLENKQGKFVDVSDKFNFNINEQTTSATVADFDNNGWSDLFIVRYGNPAMQTEQLLLLNQNGTSFSAVNDHGIISKELGATGGGAEVVDFDNDGDIDIIYANERGRWHLFENNMNHTKSAQDNNYVAVNVTLSPNKKTSLGATVTLKACNNFYKKVVGATSSPFSQGNNTKLHFGLGSCKQVESAHVTWSSGESLDFSINQINKTIHLGSKMN